jgi:hypothetical protein
MHNNPTPPQPLPLPHQPQIDAVWHTGVVLDGRTEVFFGYGINRARAGATMFGQPLRVLDIGYVCRGVSLSVSVCLQGHCAERWCAHAARCYYRESEVTPELLEELLTDMQPRFRPQVCCCTLCMCVRGGARQLQWPRASLALNTTHTHATQCPAKRHSLTVLPRPRPLRACQDYNLLFHNCNHFSNELVQLLTGESLPVRLLLSVRSPTFFLEVKT